MLTLTYNVPFTIKKTNSKVVSLSFEEWLPQLITKAVIEFYDPHGKKKCLSECLMDSNYCIVQPTDKSYEKSLKKLISERKVVKRSIDCLGVHVLRR